jgi:Ankyrin repeats (3 copies)
VLSLSTHIAFSRLPADSPSLSRTHTLCLALSLVALQRFSAAEQATGVMSSSVNQRIPLADPSGVLLFFVPVPPLPSPRSSQTASATDAPDNGIGLPPDDAADPLAWLLAQPAAPLESNESALEGLQATTEAADAAEAAEAAEALAAVEALEVAEAIEAAEAAEAAEVVEAADGVIETDQVNDAEAPESDANDDISAIEVDSVDEELPAAAVQQLHDDVPVGPLEDSTADQAPLGEVPVDEVSTPPGESSVNDTSGHLNEKLYSTQVAVGGYKWRFLVFPNGNHVEQTSVYLQCCGRVADNAMQVESADCDRADVSPARFSEDLPMLSAPHAQETPFEPSEAQQLGPGLNHIVERSRLAVPARWTSSAEQEVFDVLSVDKGSCMGQAGDAVSGDSTDPTAAPTGSQDVETYRVEVQGVLSLISADEAVPNIEKTFSHLFMPGEDDWGFREMFNSDSEYREALPSFLHENGCLVVRADITVASSKKSELSARIEAACAARPIDWLTVISSVHELPALADYSVHDDHTMRSILHLAVRKKKHDYVRYLLHHGADIQKVDGRCESPLHHAVDVDDVDMIRLLVTQHGALVDARDDVQETPLFRAVRRASTNTDVAEEIVGCLVRECGADINATNQQGRSALFSAARRGLMEFVYWLVLDLKADCLITDDDGHNAASRAERYHHEQVAMFLFEAMTLQNQSARDWDLTCHSV